MSQPVIGIDELVKILEDAVKGPQGSQYIILDDALFPAAGALVDYLQLTNDQLRIDQISGTDLIQPDKPKYKVNIVGKGNLFDVDTGGNLTSVACHINITGTAPPSEDVELRMKAEPSESSWEFSDCFPPLPEFLGKKEKTAELEWQASFYNHFPLSNVAFYVNTHSNGMPSGINLEAVLNTTVGTLGRFISKFIPETVDLGGTIELRKDTFPLLNLAADLADFDFPEIKDITSFKLELSTADKDAGDESSKNSSNADLSASAEVIDLKFTIEGSILQGNTIWVLDIGIEDPTKYTLSNGINSLLSFGGGEVTLPSGIEAFTSMYLDSLSLGFQPKSTGLRTISMIGASVKYAKDWVIPMTGVTIGDIKIHWEIANPFSGSPMLIGSISGVIALGDNDKTLSNKNIVAISIICDITGLEKGGTPSVNITGDLFTEEEGQTASIDAIVEHFTGFNPNIGLEVAKLSFEANTGDRTFFFYTSLVGDLPFKIPGVEFKEAAFGVRYSPNQFSGNVSANISVAKIPLVGYASYRGKDAGWLLKGGIPPNGDKIPNLGEFLDNLDSNWFGGVPESIKIIQLTGLMTSFDTKSKAFSLEIGVEWIPKIADKDFKIAAEFFLKSEKASDTENSYSGYVKGSLEFVDLKAAVTYAFAKNSKVFTFEIGYKSFELIAILMQVADKATPTVKGDWILKVGFGNTSFGDILEFLVHLIDPNINFKLGPPWNVLNEINLKNLSLVINLTKKTVGITYAVKKDFGFFYLDEIGLQYIKQPGKNSVNVIITGRMLEKPYTDAKPLTWDALNESPPAVPGKGNKTLDLKYLGFGQNITFRETKDFKKVEDVINALKKDFAPIDTDSDSNPLEQLPNLKFAGDGRWLIGTDFTLIDTITIAAVFNDPELYGVHLALAGEKAKQLKGLSFDILYKKVTETIGVYQLELKLPDSMRQFQFGAGSVTVPIINLDIYTNGNFRIDMGFPVGLNFTRSFCIQFWPFIGYGGFYFAILNGQTSSKVPKITNGNFAPVIEFGLALSIGLGKTIDKGILKAGLSVTIVGIVEGVLGWFHPDDKSLPSDMFYLIKGTVALTGKLYGEVNFFIISAKVEVIAYASLTLTIEAFQPILVELELGVSVSASVKILFIRIHFSFKMILELSFTVGNASPTPWILDGSSSNPDTFLLRQQRSRYAYREISARDILRAQRIQDIALDLQHPFSWNPINVFEGDIKDIQLLMMPNFTVAVPTTLNANVNLVIENDDPQVQTVMALFVPNSITANAKTHEEVKQIFHANATEKPFNQLVGGFLKWALVSFGLDLANPVTIVDLEDVQKQINKEQSAGDIFSYDLIRSFIELNYLLKISSVSSEKISEELNTTGLEDGPLGLVHDSCSETSGQEIGSLGITGLTGPVGEISAAYFPMIPDLIMSPEDRPVIDFSKHQMIDHEYEEMLSSYFQDLLVEFEQNVARNPEQPNAPQSRSNSRVDAPEESMSTFIFRDYFAMLTKQAVASAISLFSRYPYSVKESDSLESIASTFPTVSFVHQVRPHDTLGTISTQYGVQIESIKLSNDLLTSLESFDKLILHLEMVTIEKGVTPATIANANGGIQLNASVENPTIISVPGLVFQLKDQSTLDNIMIQFGITSPEDLFIGEAAKNSINPDLLLTNGKILIPQTSYKVSEGQTLLEVTAYWVMRGKLMGTGIDEALLSAYSQAIIKCNNGDENAYKDLNNLTVGESIKIPEIILNKDKTLEFVGTKPCDWKVYTVREADTLELIAGYYTLSQLQFELLTEFESLIKGLNPGVPPITTNQELVIPTFEYTIQADETLAEILELFGVTLQAALNANRRSNTIFTPLALMILPTLHYGIKDGDTLASLSNLFNLSVKDLAWKISTEPNIFILQQEIIIPDVPKQMFDKLLTDLVSNGSFNNISAMLTRFMLHGLRVPDPADDILAGLTPSKLEALDGNSIKTWGLYEIAGQQFQAPSATGPVGATAMYDITFEKGPTASWITFPDSVEEDKLKVSLTDQLIRENSPSTIFNPEVTLGPTGLPLAQNSAQQFGLEKSMHWQSASEIFAGLTGLAGVTGQVVKGPGEPSIWPFPDTLLEKLAQIGRPTGLIGATAVGRPYELIESRSQGTNGTSKRNLDYFSWGTAIELSIRQVANTQGEGTLPNSYLVLGTPESSRKYLQESWMHLQSSGEEVELHLLYSPGFVSGNPSGFVSNVLNNDGTFILKTNLSSVTHNGPQGLTTGTIEEPNSGDYYARISSGRPFLQYLWEASIIGTGGFYLNYSDKAGKGLPPELFANDTEAKIWLVVLLKSQLQAAMSEEKLLYPFNNCAIIADNVDGSAAHLFMQVTDPTPADKIKTANVGPGDIALQVTRRNPDFSGATGPEFLTKSLYNLLGYQVQGNSFFKASKEGMPVGPIEYDVPDKNMEALPNFANTDESLWDYHCVIPISKFGLYNDIPKGLALPKASKNPYQGITGPAEGGPTGLSQAKVSLQFQDLYGNRTISTTPLPDLDLFVGYTDPVIGVSAWPSTAATYRIGKNTSPVISIGISLQTSKYLPSPSYGFDKSAYSATTDVQRYKEIFYQLFQEDISLVLHTSLDQVGNIQTPYPLSRLSFRNYVAGAYVFLNQIQYLDQYQFKTVSKTGLDLLSNMFGIAMLDLGTTNQDKPANLLFEGEVQVPNLYTVRQMDSLCDILASTGTSSCTTTITGLDAPPTNVEKIANNNKGALLYTGTTLLTNLRENIPFVNISKEKNTLALVAAANASNVFYDFITPSKSIEGIGFIQVNWKIENLLEPGLDIAIEGTILNTTDFKTFEALYNEFVKSLKDLTQSDFADAIKNVQGIFATTGMFNLQDYIIQETNTFASLEKCTPSLGTIAELAMLNREVANIYTTGTAIFLYSKPYEPIAGDTLASIAGHNSLTVEQLLTVNGNTSIAVEQDILIPNLVMLPEASTSSFAPYTFKGSETLESLATLFSMTPLELAQLNIEFQGIFKDGQIAIEGAAPIEVNIESSYASVFAAYIELVPEKTFEEFVQAILSIGSIYRKDSLCMAVLPKLNSGIAHSLSTIIDDFNIQDALKVNGYDANMLVTANRALLGFLNNGAEVLGPLAEDGEPLTVTVGPYDTFNTLPYRFMATHKLDLTIDQIVEYNLDNANLITEETQFILPLNQAKSTTQINPQIPDTVFAVTVEIDILRKTSYVHPEFKGEAIVEKASSDISALPETTSKDQGIGVSYRQFAIDFEFAFVDQKLKLATGKKQGVLTTTSGKSLWAVHFGEGGINTFDVQTDKSNFYALSPLSTSLISQQVPDIKKYAPGEGLSLEGQTKTFQSVDIDLWMNDFLSIVDLMLSPEYSIPAFRLGGSASMVQRRKPIAESKKIAEGPIGLVMPSIYSEDQTGLDDYFTNLIGATGSILLGFQAYEEIVEAKDNVANQLMNRTDLIINPSIPVSSDFVLEAQQTLKEQMLVRLTNAYSIDALIQYAVKVKSTFNGQPICPRFSGPINPKVYRVTQLTSLVNLAGKIGGTGYLIDTAYLAQIISEQNLVLKTGVSVTYKGKTHEINENDTLADVATEVDVNPNPQLKNYWEQWVPFIRTIETIDLIAPNASFMDVTIRRQVSSADTMENLARYFNIAVQFFARSNASLKGIFINGLEIEWSVGKKIVTKDDESLNELLERIKVTKSTYTLDDLAISISTKNPLLTPDALVFGLQRFPENTLSTSKVSLGPLSGETPDSVMTFILNIKNEARYKKVFLNLDYVINEMEYNIANISKASDYQASSWLTFILPIGQSAGTDVGINTDLGQVEIPLPLRAYPTPPSLLSQSGVASVPEAKNISEAKLWDYNMIYQSQNAAQDTDFLEISFNNPTGKINVDAVVHPNLFNNLAQFASIQGQLRNDLALLPTLSNGQQNTRAQVAVSVFADIAKSIASSLSLVPDFSGADIAPEMKYEFRVEKSTGAAGTYLENLTLYLEKYTGPTGGAPSGDGENGGWPNIALQQKSIDSKGSAVWYPLSLKSHDTKRGVYIIPAEADILAGKPIVQRYGFDKRDVIENQNALSGVYLTRNLGLYDGNPLGVTGTMGPNSTNNAFVYKTPIVHFINRTTPFINNQNVFAIGPGDIATVLFKTLNELLETTASGTRAFKLKIACSYGYFLVDKPDQEPLISKTPIFLIPNYTYQGNTGQEFSNEIEVYIKKWKETHSISIEGGNYIFDVTVFEQAQSMGLTGPVEQLPILQLNNLQLPIGATGVMIGEKNWDEP
ncbi:LysM peptidoglycan-binding domain-containing protein [Aequorivita antarctica]|uniref:LysM peptidoglycan-binding domain-containing protein n=1 Tax=Aequorivita antarctica TaxID=153266 RepID=A0A5C6YZC3_9FLAO|nr:LysM peptidoglycan-binding domain-containing protein [Aequorivita antarctica]TXD72777.1 LysM peptidoglycan-binding domain-containing protein [Aequorivita antarctica]SRX76223.1 hypothetical protein AEQU3_03222 [Aequorivita antarctica]